jgi:hypothetical protein
MKAKSLQILGIILFAACQCAVRPAAAGTFTLNFSSTGGTIYDTNTLGTGFTTRLANTGAALNLADDNLLLDTNAGTLKITSTTADFNGQAGLPIMEAIGIQLSSIGFTGSNDFTITANYINVPDNSILTSFDQIGLFVGIDSATLTRGTLVNYDFFGGSNEGVGIDVQNGTDTGGNYFGMFPGTNMTIVVRRTGGTWQVLVNNIDKTPTQPTYLNSATDLTAGICVFDTGGAHPTPNNKFVATLDSFTATVVEAQTGPVISNQPQKQLVNEGNPATFSVTVTPETASPRYYFWRHNGTPIPNGTNSTLTITNATTNDVGDYSVIVSNSISTATSSNAPLYVVLPAGKFSLDFHSVSGGVNTGAGVGTGFPTRLPGTGTSLPVNDTNLSLNTNTGILSITTTTTDFNCNTNAYPPTNYPSLPDETILEALGVSLSSLGFTGSQDFNVLAHYPQPFPATVAHDQFGAFVGISTNFLTRGGCITFAGKERFTQNVQPGNDGFPGDGGGQFFGFGFDSTIPMSVLISRNAGVWHCYIDGVQWDVLVQPGFLNGTSNLTAGVFALDTPETTDGVTKTVGLDGFTARVFNPPNLNVASGGGNLTFTWNVAGAKLQSNTSLSNSNGWTNVTNATNSPFVISLPASGNKFYRTVQ